MNREVLQYRVHYLLKTYVERVKREDAKIKSNTDRLSNSSNHYVLPSDIKRSQLYSELIYEAIAHFTTDVWEKNGPKIAGDILHDLSGEHGRRNAYGTLIQDSRR
jgi:hypothetical protein